MELQGWRSSRRLLSFDLDANPLRDVLDTITLWGPYSDPYYVKMKKDHLHKHPRLLPPRGCC